MGWESGRELCGRVRERWGECGREIGDSGVGAWEEALRESAGGMGEMGDRGWESGREHCGRDRGLGVGVWEGALRERWGRVRERRERYGQGWPDLNQAI